MQSESTRTKFFSVNTCNITEESRNIIWFKNNIYLWIRFGPTSDDLQARRVDIRPPKRYYLETAAARGGLVASFPSIHVLRQSDGA